MGLAFDIEIRLAPDVNVTDPISLKFTQAAFADVFRFLVTAAKVDYTVVDEKTVLITNKPEDKPSTPGTITIAPHDLRELPARCPRQTPRCSPHDSACLAAMRYGNVERASISRLSGGISALNCASFVAVFVFNRIRQLSQHGRRNLSQNVGQHPRSNRFLPPSLSAFAPGPLNSPLLVPHVRSGAGFGSEYSASAFCINWSDIRCPVRCRR